jgi:hypothetical protein
VVFTLLSYRREPRFPNQLQRGIEGIEDTAHFLLDLMQKLFICSGFRAMAP